MEIEYGAAGGKIAEDSNWFNNVFCVAQFRHDCWRIWQENMKSDEFLSDKLCGIYSCSFVV